MFDKKEIEPEKVDLTESCAECKHLVLRKDMVGVKWRNVSYVGSSGVEWYCPEHAPKYDRWQSVIFSAPQYYKELEVSEDGTPIGYVKVAPKKENDVQKPIK